MACIYLTDLSVYILNSSSKKHHFWIILTIKNNQMKHGVLCIVVVSKRTVPMNWQPSEKHASWSKLRASKTLVIWPCLEGDPTTKEEPNHHRHALVSGGVTSQQCVGAAPTSLKRWRSLNERFLISNTNEGDSSNLVEPFIWCINLNVLPHLWWTRSSLQYQSIYQSISHLACICWTQQVGSIPEMRSRLTNSFKFKMVITK